MSERTLPVRFDLTGEDAIVQGSYWRREFSFVYADETLWDTGGYTGRMQIRRADGSLVATFTSTSGALATGIQGPTDGRYNLSITISQGASSGLADWGIGVYSVEITDAETRTFRVLEGNCALSPEVTI